MREESLLLFRRSCGTLGVNQSLKAVLQLLAIVCGIVSLCVWLIPQRPDAIVWTCRVLFPLATIALGYVLFRVARNPDLAPDILRQQFGTYFERDGLCFAPVMSTSTKDGTCWINVFFQNRYAGACTCDLIIQPCGKSFSLGRHDVPTVAVQIDCPGGAMGVTRVPYPVPAKYQGKKVRYEIAARTKYPAGAGQMLRFREGLRVGSHQHALGQAAKTLGLLAVGVISYHRPATITVTLPTHVAETATSEATVQTELLWSFDAPTGGFPVVALATATGTAGR
jgi:hypothetical protein